MNDHVYCEDTLQTRASAQQGPFPTPIPQTLRSCWATRPKTHKATTRRTMNLRVVPSLNRRRSPCWSSRDRGLAKPDRGNCALISPFEAFPCRAEDHRYELGPFASSSERNRTSQVNTDCVPRVESPEQKRQVLFHHRVHFPDHGWFAMASQVTGSNSETAEATDSAAERSALQWLPGLQLVCAVRYQSSKTRQRAWLGLSVMNQITRNVQHTCRRTGIIQFLLRDALLSHPPLYLVLFDVAVPYLKVEAGSVTLYEISVLPLAHDGLHLMCLYVFVEPSLFEPTLILPFPSGRQNVSHEEGR
jgi:hypothetical protein